MNKKSLVTFLVCIIFISNNAMEKVDENKFSSMTPEAIKHFLAIKIIQKKANKCALENELYGQKDYPYTGCSPKSTKQGLFLETNELNELIRMISPWGFCSICLSEFCETPQTIDEGWRDIRIAPIIIEKSISERKISGTYLYPILSVEGIQLPAAELGEKSYSTKEIIDLWDKMEEQHRLYKALQEAKNKLNPEWEKIRMSYNNLSL